MVRTLRVDRARAKELLADESLYATDLADYLVKKGVAFRQAHETVGRIVTFAEAKHTKVSKISLDILRKFSPKIGGDVYALFDPEHSVRLKRTQGSTHPTQIKKQIKKWKRLLAGTTNRPK